MRDIIEVEKELLPYNFDIVLAGEEFNMAMDYNKAADLFTCTISKDGKVVVYNEPLIYGKELFADVYRADFFPAVAIVPFDEACNEKAVTYENFGKTVFLTIDDQEESIAELLAKAAQKRKLSAKKNTTGNTTSKLGVAILGSMILGQ